MRKQKVAILTTVLLLLAASLSLLGGCGDMKGDVDVNQAPSVRFVTVPLDSSEFNFAPIIYWTGSDPDGFVEYYSYADITDSAAFEDPIAFYDKIPDEAWTDTIATQARIFLLTEAGERTPHIFYVRCFDNEGQVSEDVVYRTFFRTNQAPDIPRIGLVGWEDEEIQNDVYLRDTLFVGEQVNETWGGVRFTWRGQDPDDKALYRIPLQFQPILVKAPGDTIFQREWSSETEITLSNLETGFYTLYVWARDDGFTLSTAPARAEFNVIKPTFEHNILIVLEPVSGNFHFPTSGALDTFYTNLITDISADITVADIAMDGENVRIEQLETANDSSDVIPMSLIHQYKMVIFASDKFKQAQSAYGSDYISWRNKVLADYMRVGGRTWYMGRMLVPTALWGSDQGTANEEANSRDLRSDFFAVDQVYGPAWQGVPGTYAEFIGTRAGLSSFPSLEFDTSKVEENWLSTLGYLPGSYGQSGVQSIARGENVVTTQYFVSRTASTLK